MPWGWVIHTQLALAAEPTSARTARQFVGDALTDWGLAHAAEMAILLASELVTNAIRHAGSDDILVRLEWAGGTAPVRVEVHDHSLDLPAQPAATPRGIELDPLALSGRGLALVEVCADDWGVRVADDGKAVWFELGTVPRRRPP
jgi:anti-sigma regulatory factor (Ser/Thr protein kinase)